MGTFFRIVVALLLGSSLACAGETPNPVQPEEKTLAISVTAPDDNKIVEALDLRDLEHFIVSKLKHVQVFPFTSIQDSLETDEGVYVVDIGIDEADIAQRPKWTWADQRFRDDEILHLELSLSVTRLRDNASLGTLNHSYEYRADDYGRFSSPQVIRGAVLRSSHGAFSNLQRASSTAISAAMSRHFSARTRFKTRLTSGAISQS